MQRLLDMERIKVAFLDDYQGVATNYGDWSFIKDHTDITVFSKHISEHEGLAELLLPFEIICIMRERTPITASLLSKLPNLKLIVSTGPRNAAIDLEAVKNRGVEVAHTGYIGNGAPELTWALLMAIARNIPQESVNLRNGAWQTTVGTDLKGKIMGIVGLGNIGTRIAIIAKAFEMQVISWSPNLDGAKAEVHGIQSVTKAELFRKSDFISVHMVLSGTSAGIIKYEDMALMKKSAFLINTSRGPLIDEQDLIKILSERKIAGAGLDVFNQEPLPADHPFAVLDNVLATPHIGYVTHDTYNVFFNDTRNIIQNWLMKKTYS